tara:strand:- start:1790 stop:2566 length:777 start_codon:yes stop_codon:yes gene_type:complete
VRVLIFGLPGSGKTYLASRLKKYLGDHAEHFNADKVRAEANDWDFSDAGRKRQSERMSKLVTNSVSNGKIAIADFIAPFRLSRQQFDADYKIWVDTISNSRYANTDAIFEKPTKFDYRVKEKDFNKDAIRIAWELGRRAVWNNKAPTTQMLGRYQPWHDGHQALFDRAMAKHGQVHLMIRDMETDDSNPYTANQVKENLEKELRYNAGKVKIEIVPNIMNITYGRDVGYKIEQEQFDKSIENISATKIREKNEDHSKG